MIPSLTNPAKLQSVQGSNNNNRCVAHHVAYNENAMQDCSDAIKGPRGFSDRGVADRITERADLIVETQNFAELTK